jgi:hypothetical protein
MAKREKGEMEDCGERASEDFFLLAILPFPLSPKGVHGNTTTK